MPRKKILGPATARQVLDYFETASDVEVQLVASLVEGALAKRFAPTLKASNTVGTGSERKTRGPGRKKAAAPEQYGETLREA